jgi:hypothetical protein
MLTKTIREEAIKRQYNHHFVVERIRQLATGNHDYACEP